MDLLPPQVDNGLVEPPTGAGAPRLTSCQCPCWALRQPVKVRAKKRAIIHHPGRIKYATRGNILFKPGALHLRNTSTTCSSGVPSHVLHNRPLRLHTICSLCSVSSPTCCVWVESAVQLSDYSVWRVSIMHQVLFCLFKRKSVSPWKQTRISTRGRWIQCLQTRH